MEYKKSQFTIIEKVEEGYWLYNSLYNLKALVYEEDYKKQISDLVGGKTISDKDIIDEIKPFCVEEGCNEVQLALGMHNYKNIVDDTLRLIIVATMACNFKCIYCYEHQEMQLVMDDNFINNLLNAIKDYKKQYGMKRIIIEWFGGEPLLAYKQICNVIEKLNKWCQENDIAYQYTATTNGYYLTKDMYEFLCEKGFTRFSVTLDGFKETHNKFRSSKKEGEDTWNVITRNLSDIKNSKGKALILLRANYNFELLSYIDEYVAFLADNFNTSKFEVYFYPIKKWGGENDSSINVIDDSLYLLSSTAILDALNKHNLRSNYYINKLKLFSHICYAGDVKSFYINVNGDIQKCSLFPSSGNKLVVIGTIEGGKFDINERANIQYTTPDYNLMREKGCYQCEYLPLCYGLGCPYSILLEKEIRCIKEKYDMEGIILHDYKTKRQGEK